MSTSEGHVYYAFLVHYHSWTRELLVIISLRSFMLSFAPHKKTAALKRHSGNQLANSHTNDMFTIEKWFLYLVGYYLVWDIGWI